MGGAGLCKWKGRVNQRLNAAGGEQRQHVSFHRMGEPGKGTGPSRRTSMSGPPGSRIAIKVIDLGRPPFCINAPFKGDRINLSAADVTTGIEAAKNHFMQE